MPDAEGGEKNGPFVEAEVTKQRKFPFFQAGRANSVDGGGVPTFTTRMEISHTGLGWSRPFPVALAAHLKERFGVGGAYDGVLLWVPSSRFGRHVLAELFIGEHEALHPPLLMTPDQYRQKWRDSMEGLATDPERLLAWRTAMERIPRERLEGLFPGVARNGGRKVPFELAVQLVRLQEELAEMEWTMAAVARKASEDVGRWEVLAELEAQYHSLLEGRQRRDPNRAMKAAHQLPDEVLSCDRLLIAGVHNLTLRQRRLVGDMAQAGLMVEAVWPLPEEALGTLDAWGCPDPAHWLEAEIPDELLQASLVKVADPMPAIRSTIQLAQAYADPIDALSLAACEEEVRDLLIEVAAVEGVSLYNPEGETLEQSDIGRCVLRCLSWRQAQAFEDLEALLEHALFQTWCQRREIDSRQAQRDLDELRGEHLFDHFPAIVDPSLRPLESIRRIRALVTEMEASLFSGFADGFLVGIWRLLNSLEEGHEGPMGADLHGLVEDLHEVFGRSLEPGDGQDLVRHLMRVRRVYPERRMEERPVSGWLEAPWETAPHLVLLGVPDRAVPGSDGQSPFVTPGLKRDLGMPGAAEEAALHALRLRILLESRLRSGCLQIMLYYRTLDESPVLPSRFLFNTRVGNTVARATLLMQDRGQPVPVPAARFGACLKLPEPRPREHISVSALNAYLRNPFGYYLSSHLKWKPFEELPRELDALRFGEIAHTVLDETGRIAQDDPFMGEEALKGHLLERLDAVVRQQLGSSLSVAVRIQIESLRQRLRHAAPVIAECLGAGWRIEATEWAFPDDGSVHIGSMRLSGRIDLILRHELDDAYLLIDYKTSDTALAAEKAHLVGTRTVSEDAFLPERYFPVGNQTRRWINLQLPLYVQAFRRSRGHLAQCGYINLAKAVSDIGLSKWTITEEELASAVACAEAIVASIQAGKFPHEAKGQDRDPFLPWLGNDPFNTVCRDWRERHMEATK